MSTNGKAMSAVRRAIEQLNQQLPVGETRVDPNPQTRLNGRGRVSPLAGIDRLDHQH